MKDQRRRRPRPDICAHLLGVVLLGFLSPSTQAADAFDADDTVVGDGSAALLVLDLESGALIRRIGTGAGTDSDPNGLSSPTAVDLDLDVLVDRVYAENLDGALWAFDLTSSTPSAWHVAFSSLPFFSARRTGGEPQAITTPPPRCGASS